MYGCNALERRGKERVRLPLAAILSKGRKAAWPHSPADYAWRHLPGNVVRQPGETGDAAAGGPVMRMQGQYLPAAFLHGRR